MFIHTPVVISEVATQVSIDGKGPRLYKTPKGDIFPSITTILAPLKEEILREWRKRVGDKEADRASNWGKTRGTALHLALEHYLDNKSLAGHPLLVRALLEDLLPYLKKINNISCQESTLYSDIFRIGGRTDCIADYGGTLSVIDFKGSGRSKREEWIEDYFIQGAFYAWAFYERTGIKAEKIVILIANEQGIASEFISEPHLWWKKLKEVREEYKRRFKI
jgi:genome maintenance exonuclease 1